MVCKMHSVFFAQIGLIYELLNCFAIQASHCVHVGTQVTSFRRCWISRRVDFWSIGSIVFVFFLIQDYLFIKVLHYLNRHCDSGMSGTDPLIEGPFFILQSITHHYIPVVDPENLHFFTTTSQTDTLQPRYNANSGSQEKWML